MTETKKDKAPAETKAPAVKKVEFPVKVKKDGATKLASSAEVLKLLKKAGWKQYGDKRKRDIRFYFADSFSCGQGSKPYG